MYYYNLNVIRKGSKKLLTIKNSKRLVLLTPIVYIVRVYIDHSISYLIWYSKTSASPRLNSFRSCKNLDAEKFRDDIQNQAWSELTDCETVDEAVEVWQKLLLNVVNKHMPHAHQKGER